MLDRLSRNGRIHREGTFREIEAELKYEESLMAEANGQGGIDLIRAANYLEAWRKYRAVDDWETSVKARRFALEEIKSNESGAGQAVA